MRLFVRTSAPIGRRTAVTLTELTVVIAIIVVLSGLSFFSFTSAKSFADKIEGEANWAHGTVVRNAKKTGATPLPPHLSPPTRPDVVPGEYYIGLNPAAGSPADVAQRLADLVGGQVVGVYTHGTYGCGIRCPDANISRLQGDVAVRLVQQARYGRLCSAPPNIRRVYSNGIMGTQATTSVNKMFGAPPSVFRMYRNTSAHGIVSGRAFLGGATTAQVAVACLDSGIDSTHPDLNVVYAQDFTGSNDPTDTLGHGTHVAGVVGAVDQTASSGVVGVYPGAPLMNLKITVGSLASTLAVYAALDFVIAHAATIPVCLMGIYFSSDPIMDAMVTQAANQGIIVVAAAGFTSGGTGQNLDTSPLSPASAPGAITVGNLVDGDGLPGGLLGSPDDTYGSIAGVYCPYGSVVAFAAPGGCPAVGGYAIQSTIPLTAQAANGLSSPYSNNINGAAGASAWGSSFSAAHVAGMMALLKDPQTNFGIILGAGRGVTTYHLQMRNRAEAVAALMNATHRPEPFQMVNPLTGSAWHVTGFPRRVSAYTKSLYGDYATDPAGQKVPVANFYANPGVGPAFLPPFPG